jgi:hypothetical protein
MSVFPVLAVLFLAACGAPGPQVDTRRSLLTSSTGGTASLGTWFLAGSKPQDYQMSGDPTGSVPGSLQLTSSSADGSVFGTAMTRVDPSAHLGKRIRLTATVSAATLTDWAGLWMRVDGPNKQVLAFDNMQSRSIIGTQSAQPYSVVLDVAADATKISYGVLLVGSGEVGVSGLIIEEVDASVPVTGLPEGWCLVGSDPSDYGADGDPTSPSGLTLRSRAAQPSGFGTAMTQIPVATYAGQRLRLSANVSAQNVAGWGGMWLRVDGVNEQQLALDNMQNRPITGTSAAASYAVVLDVPPGAVDLAYGVLLSGTGALTADTLTLEVVDASVPTTE